MSNENLLKMKGQFLIDDGFMWTKAKSIFNGNAYTTSNSKLISNIFSIDF